MNTKKSLGLFQIIFDLLVKYSTNTVKNYYLICTVNSDLHI